MRATQDFNYKVALASGLKSLQAGRLRQAEEQFRYLVQKFPAQDGGYRGLAKVLIELEDRPAALAALREGAAALAKGGAREQAIALLRDAITLDPADLATHRRLAAALWLAQDTEGAMTEVERYVHTHVAMSGVDHARSEIGYALERFGEHPRLGALANRFGVAMPEKAEEPAPDPEPEPEPARREEPVSREVAPAVAQEPAPAEPPPADWPRIAQLPASPTAAAPALVSADDAATAEARAAELLARGDGRAGEAALAAARAHIAEGHLAAASDLLLGLIASGVRMHEAQRMLIDVTRTLNKPDLTRAKAALLAQALRLEGRTAQADEIDRLVEGV